MKTKKIGIITYKDYHKKSIDLFYQLISKNYKDITILYIEKQNTRRRKTLINYRSKQYPNIFEFENLKKKFNLKTKFLKSTKDYKDLDYVLIGDSNIIPKKLIVKNLIINCHPGLIPITRGLDSFKWSIFYGQPLGNTLHFIDQKVENGKILHHEITPINEDLSISQAAKIHYKNEIKLLSNFENFLNQNENTIFKLKTLPLNKKMDSSKEKITIKKYKFYRKNYSNILTSHKIKKKIISRKSSIKDINHGIGCKIIEPVNIYGAKFGNFVFVGPFVEITQGVEIGDMTKISSHSFICELVKIGKNCFIGHSVNFINDTFSDGKVAGGDKKKWKKTSIEDNVLIGTNSTILPVKIKKGCVIGAGSVVTKDCEIRGIYAGNPAKLIRKL